MSVTELLRLLLCHPQQTALAAAKELCTNTAFGPHLLIAAGLPKATAAAAELGVSNQERQARGVISMLSARLAVGGFNPSIRARMRLAGKEMHGQVSPASRCACEALSDRHLPSLRPPPQEAACAVFLELLRYPRAELPPNVTAAVPWRVDAPEALPLASSDGVAMVELALAALGNHHVSKPLQEVRAREWRGGHGRRWRAGEKAGSVALRGCVTLPSRPSC